MSREEFLRGAAPEVNMMEIRRTDHQRFARALELINKTNQFNTTGRRWKIEECEDLFLGSGRFYAFEVKDRFTNYGLVGVVVVDGISIQQWVMSCRILGYDIEIAVMTRIAEELRGDESAAVIGHLQETEVNFPSRDLFARCGFLERDHAWVLPPDVRVSVPSHVRII
jgi:FkbH-like protein